MPCKRIADLLASDGPRLRFFGHEWRPRSNKHRSIGGGKLLGRRPRRARAATPGSDGAVEKSRRARWRGGGSHEGSGTGSLLLPLLGAEAADHLMIRSVSVLPWESNGVIEPNLPASSGFEAGLGGRAVEVAVEVAFA